MQKRWGSLHAHTMLEDSRVKAFMEVARYGNISRAALSLSLTQSTVSHHILTLENDLGVKLFNRTQQGVSLTGAGKVFMEYATRMTSLEDMVREIFKEDPSGTLLSPYVILADALCLECVLPRALSTIHSTRPAVRFTLMETASDLPTTQEGFCLYCREGTGQLGLGMEGTVLGGFEMGAFCSEGTLTALGRQGMELSGRGAGPSTLPPSFRFALWEPFAAHLGVDALNRTALRSESLPALVRFTQSAQDTVALLPDLAPLCVQEGGAPLRRVPLSLPALSYDIVALYSENNGNRALTSLLCKVIEESLRI